MKKVILYGVTCVELRRNAEAFLDDEFEIAGYSDTYYTKDVLDGKPFFPPEELYRQKADYILLLAFSHRALHDMRIFLRAVGIEDKKIIEPLIFLHQNAEKGQIDLVKDIRQHYQGEQGLIFGLSYSFRDIELGRLSLPFYNCSWSGLDIYYNFRIFQYMDRQGLTRAVKTAFLIFPYYYFDYDMSRSVRQYENGQMFAVVSLDDWHNSFRIREAEGYIANYKLFGKKTAQFYHVERYEFQNGTICQEKEGILDKIWFREYEDTVLENKILLTRFIKQLADRGIKPVLIIPPFFLYGLEQASLAAFEQKKKKFYRVLMEVQEKIMPFAVYDYADAYADKRDFFMDVTHLNSTGAVAFTDQINRDVLHR
ncbi:MAG: hypothetical protein OSJ69_02155 [Acetatifactor sp.]|nr:hypothetical protein [Acetatifactor sp.]